MLVLTMLRQSPKTGSEIMDQVELASQGWWRPSPGSVYPLLTELSNEGIITKREDGRYELTEKGKEETNFPWGRAGRQPRSTEETVAEIDSYISYLEDISRTDKSKLVPQKEQLSNIRDRLRSIVDSL